MHKPTSEPSPEFSFGIFADVQYADVDKKQNFEKTAWRYYRQSLTHLNRAVTKWNQSEHRIDLLLNLGDLLDGHNKGSQEGMAKIEGTLGKFEGTGGVHHTWGNHEFYNFAREDLKKTFLFSSNCDTSYYHFSPHPKLRIVVLDAYDVSLIGESEGSPVYNQAKKILQAHNPNKCLLSPEGMKGMEKRYSQVNGALGDEQLEWLKGVLTQADTDEEWVIVMAHCPTYEASSYDFCMLWNYDQLLSILHQHACVKLYLSGHDHDGGFARDEHGLHHVTLRGVIEAPLEEDPTATAHVYKDKIVLCNIGPRFAPIQELVIDISS